MKRTPGPPIYESQSWNTRLCNYISMLRIIQVYSCEKVFKAFCKFCQLYVRGGFQKYLHIFLHNIPFTHDIVNRRAAGSPCSSVHFTPLPMSFYFCIFVSKFGCCQLMLVGTLSASLIRRLHETGSMEGAPLTTALQKGRWLPHRLGDVPFFALPIRSTSPPCTGFEEENPLHTTHNDNLPIGCLVLALVVGLKCMPGGTPPLYQQ